MIPEENMVSQRMSLAQILDLSEWEFLQVLPDLTEGQIPMIRSQLRAKRVTDDVFEDALQEGLLLFVELIRKIRDGQNPTPSVKWSTWFWGQLSNRINQLAQSEMVGGMTGMTTHTRTYALSQKETQQLTGRLHRQPTTGEIIEEIPSANSRYLISPKPLAITADNEDWVGAQIAGSTNDFWQFDLDPVDAASTIRLALEDGPWSYLFAERLCGCLIIGATTHVTSLPEVEAALGLNPTHIHELLEHLSLAS